MLKRQILPATFARLCALVLVAALIVPAAAFGVTREAVLERGEVWVAKNVPYSQSGYATASGTLVSSSASGWRRDCSGFVSMCLGLTYASGNPLSLDTATLPYRMTKLLNRDQLRPGDVILRPKTATRGGHAVVFVRWANATKTRYVGYHERGTAYGTVAEEISYPYKGLEGFAPYRYTAIENVRLRKSRTWIRPLLPATTASAPLVPSMTPTTPITELTSPPGTAPLTPAQ